ncbi:MAG TPA: exodeoxyribonuclease VII large subunit, partial [Blastocatellia bacterium]|nr:exodeoxyribonuclease VII large subunit [Blastocatellia bacterium]
ARDEIMARIAGFTEDMTNAMRYRLLELRNHASELESSRAFAEVEMRIHSAAQRFDETVYRAQSAFQQAIKTKREQQTSAMSRLQGADIRRAMIKRRGELGVLRARLKAGTRAELDRSGERFSVAVGKLDSLSPLAVLARGYAIAFDQNGQIIKRADDVSQGERVRIRVADGEMDCTKN